MTNPVPPLIVGYGNPLRGDDGAGWQVAERLAVRAGHLAEVQTHHQLTPDMALGWSQAPQVILIDASVDTPPGHIARRVLQPSARPVASFSHHVNAELLMSLTHALFGHCPRVTLYTIAGQHFALSEQLSPPVAQAATRLVARLERWLRCRAG